MQAFRMNPEIQQRLAVVVPLLALGLSLFVVYPGWGRHGVLKDKITAQRKELADLKAAAPPQPGTVQPTANDQASEPSEFLGLITQMASQTQCMVSGLDASTVEKAKDTSVIHNIRARVEVQGRYPGVRQFISMISHSPRLLVVTDVTLASLTSVANPGLPQAAQSGLVRATIEVERYIAPSNPPTAPPAVPPVS